MTDAIDPIDAGARPHHMTDAWDIGEVLSALAASGDPVTVYQQGVPGPVMARILWVDQEQPDFIVELNPGVTLAPGPAMFVAWAHNAKLQFSLDQEWRTAPDQPDHLPARFPLECLVLERRESARLETPLGVYYVAAFVLDGRPYELQLYDFSLGGVGMRAPPRDTMGLYVGRKLSRVRLELGRDKVMVADLEVRLSRTFRSFLVGEQVQIGCRFVNLSQAMQAQLQDLIGALEGSRKGR
ncbi:MAG: PilZ domain-containing protein [Pseudomonadota bacterium]